MKRFHILLCLWTIALIQLSAQVHLEQKAKQHFLDKNWRESTILFELIHKTQNKFTDPANYGRSIVASYKWNEGNRLGEFYRIARTDSLTFEQIIALSDKAMIEVKIGNQMSDLLFQLIDLEQSISDQFWYAIVNYLTDQREYEKAYRAKQMQIERRTITDPDRLELATLALQNNQIDVALKYYKEVLQTEPLNTKANIGLGSILYVKGKELYDKRPKQSHLFLLNTEEERDRYLWLKKIFDNYFNDAITALKIVEEINSNRFTAEKIVKMEDVKKELETLESKLQKVEKYKHIIHNKTK